LKITSRNVRTGFRIGDKNECKNSHSFMFKINATSKETGSQL